MVESLLDEVHDQVAQSPKHIDHARKVLRDTCDEVTGQSKVTLRKGRRTAVLLKLDAEHALRSRPVQAIAGFMAVGLAVGFLFGWILARRN